nr:hypothetical protein [Tanacetum cinerariifolium]
MSRDVITVGSTMRIPLLYRGEYSQWHKRFMNYLEEQTYGEAMINSIQNGDQPLPVIAQVSLARNAQNAPPTLKDPKFWTAKEKKTQNIDRAAAGTDEEQAKNFQWGLRRSTLNHLMCMSYTDVAQVANAARNYEILHERDDDDIERPDKRRMVNGISRPLSRVVTGTTVIITTVMGQTSEVVVTTIAATTTTLATTS